MNKQQKSSITALITAFARAYHFKEVSNPIFADHLAYDLVGEANYNFLAEQLAAHYSLMAPTDKTLPPKEALAWVMANQSSPITVSRAKYTEGYLENNKDVLKQYIILGAGYDTYALRKPDSNIAVYELDHANTQEAKKQRICELNWDIPPHLQFIPIDFESDDLQSTLDTCSINTQLPSLFSWLGVAMYLPHDTFIRQLKKIAQVAASGSIIIFDFLDEDAFDENKASAQVKLMLQLIKNSGEPALSGLNPKTLAQDLSPYNLEVKELLTPDDIQQRFFQNRTDGYKAFDHIHLACLQVI